MAELDQRIKMRSFYSPWGPGSCCFRTIWILRRQGCNCWLVPARCHCGENRKMARFRTSAGALCPRCEFKQKEAAINKGAKARRWEKMYAGTKAGLDKVRV